LNVFGKTDTGRMRPNNQDAFVCGRLFADSLFAVVCDGMGGANGGNVASAMAIRIVADRIVDTYRQGMGGGTIKNLLESAVAAANVEIFDTSMAEPELRGMGTTAVAVIAAGRDAYIAHVGDSRAYLLTGQGIEQLTRDHSIVQAMVEKGQLTEDEAKNHPRKHFITRALGVEETVQCDYTEISIPEDGALLLCTDGLTNMVDADDIYAVVRKNGAEQAVQQLLDAANAAGGSDNITAVLLA
jgi:hypothetical protein